LCHIIIIIIYLAQKRAEEKMRKLNKCLDKLGVKSWGLMSKQNDQENVHDF
jgi:hypothetical protein